MFRRKSKRLRDAEIPSDVELVRDYEFLDEYKRVSAEKENLEGLARNKLTSSYLFIFSSIKFYLFLVGRDIESLLSSAAESIENRRKKLSRQLTQRALLIWLHYCCVKFSIVTYLQFKHDSLLQQWRPTLRQNAPTFLDGRCALASDIIPDQQLRGTDIIAELSKLRHWMDALGAPWVYLTGTSTIVYDVCAVALMGLPIGTYHYLVYRSSFRLNFFQYILDPPSEYHRLRSEQYKIASSLSKTKRHHSARCWPPYYQHTKRFAKQEIPGPDRASDFQFEGHRKYERLRQNGVIATISFDSDHHRRYLMLIHYSLLLYYLINVTVGIFWATSLTVSENYIRAQHRINQFTCQSWQTNGMLVRDQELGLASLTDLKDSDMYSSITSGNVSLSQIFYLGIFVETKYSMRGWNYLTWFELVTTFQISLFCSTFTLIMYLFALIYRLIWVAQLQNQIHDSIEIFNRSIEDLKSAEAQLVERLIEFISNMRLFKREFGPYKRICDQMIFQVVAVAGQIMIVCYFVTLKSNVKIYFVISVGLLYMLVYINIYLAAGSYLFYQITKLTIQMYKLEARFMLYPETTFDYLRDILRRQLMSKKELEKVYAFSLMGSYGSNISSSQLMSFNFYMLTLLVLFSRL